MWYEGNIAHRIIQMEANGLWGHIESSELGKKN
jgi:hypothetical protein